MGISPPEKGGDGGADEGADSQNDQWANAVRTATFSQELGSGGDFEY